MKKKFLQINEKYKYKINLEYPVTNLENINNLINKTLKEIIKEFTEISKRSVQLNMYYTLYITYDEFLYDGITSYIFKISEFTGGAHPNNYLKSIRFDQKGKIINIESLIKKDNDILSKLSSLSRKDLLSRNDFVDNEITSMAINGTRPFKENFNNFAFTKEGLLVFFDYYQVAPYYYGVQKVLIPYNKLDII